MKELVAVMGGMGYEKIQTYIQSGNVVFKTRAKLTNKDATAISRQLMSEKGFEPKVMLLSASMLEQAVQNNPFPSDIGKSLHLYFLESSPVKPDTQLLNSNKSKSEQYRLDKKVFYLYAPDGIGRSKLAASVENALGVPVTARNWNTIRRLCEMVELPHSNKG